jgi:hypothetical protein
VHVDSAVQVWNMFLKAGDEIEIECLNEPETEMDYENTVNAVLAG